MGSVSPVSLFSEISVASLLSAAERPQEGKVIEPLAAEGVGLEKQDQRVEEADQLRDRDDRRAEHDGHEAVEAELLPGGDGGHPNGPSEDVQDAVRKAAQLWEKERVNPSPRRGVMEPPPQLAPAPATVPARKTDLAEWYLRAIRSHREVQQRISSSSPLTPQPQPQPGPQPQPWREGGAQDRQLKAESAGGQEAGQVGGGGGSAGAAEVTESSSTVVGPDRFRENPFFKHSSAAMSSSGSRSSSKLLAPVRTLTGDSEALHLMDERCAEAMEARHMANEELMGRFARRFQETSDDDFVRWPERAG